MQNDGQLIVAQIPSGPIDTNAYLVIDPESREALIIDAPANVLTRLAAEVRKHGATPVGLVLTHTHWDHIGDAAAIAEKYAIPIMLHELDGPGLQHPSGPEVIRSAAADQLLADGDTVMIGSRQFQVLHTPGHSHGQISLYGAQDGILLGGDTLFPNGYGRVDIPGASEEETIATLAKLLELPDDVTVLPGHGSPTLIGQERRWMTRVVETGQMLS